MKRLLKHVGVWATCVAACTAKAGAAPDAAYDELRGNWQVVELVDNGRVIAKEAIPAWLASGGRMEFVSNSIVFTSPKDGQRYARVFSLDATTYPRQINVIEDKETAGHGIYRLDDGRLVVCLSPPSVAPRPDDFSAREGSRRVMMVLERADTKPEATKTPAQLTSTTPVLNLPAPPTSPPAAPAPMQPAAKPLTDADIGKLLPGTWKCNDTYGAFFLTLDKNGIYGTYRETVESSAYQKVFRKLPVSNGTWKLNNGQVVLQCTSAVSADRVYKSFPFTIRSVTSTDLAFVDYAGNVGKAVRVQP